MCLVAWATSGCSSAIDAAKKIGQVIMDPSIQVGKDTDQPSTLRLTLLAEPNINPNSANQPSPINLQVIYLTEDSMLQATYYDQLQETELKDILGKNYLDHQDYTLVPAQYKPLPEITLDEKNQYLGLIAYYSNPEISEWKQVIKLNGTGGHRYHVLAQVKKQHLIIKVEKE
ncbi:type VI secretion system lipoprotein TssJ [Muribacter muris]|nr:type VI secretion system lipoprotein TssJ [Muribacter muris]MBF0828000.1 type VI secretion system lipoprotein TssJ [Muribacter muris]TFV09132.1 type VI secretion system lipoprotein TssJ [Muribacter muris]